jgi:hypothetical protein
MTSSSPIPFQEEYQRTLQADRSYLTGFIAVVSVMWISDGIVRPSARRERVEYSRLSTVRRADKEDPEHAGEDGASVTWRSTDLRAGREERLHACPLGIGQLGRQRASDLLRC